MQPIARPASWCFLFSAALAACYGSPVPPAADRRQSGGGQGAGLSRWPDGGGAASGATVPGAAGESCAEVARTARRVPVDLLLLVDRSGSMNARNASGASKWEMARAALVAFVRDPRSAGLGVGVQYFPAPGTVATCLTDSECLFPGTLAHGLCGERRGCVGPGRVDPDGAVELCGASNDAPCPTGTTCRALGRCVISGADCLALGQPCPGGVTEDVCTATAQVCHPGPARESCTVADYARPAVAIDELPAAEASLVRSLSVVTAQGETPTDPAVQGALAHLRNRAAIAPGRRQVLLLVTDGLPLGCQSNAVPLIRAQLSAARSETPSITSYVIGVFAGLDLVFGGQSAANQWATAGGTGVPFVLAPGDDLGARLLEALNQIRGLGLSCDLAIPAPSPGGTLDFTRVNVSVTTTAGPEEIGYAARADRCDPARGGWFYDVDPAANTPTRVILCEATCQRLTADPAAHIELRLGCQTRIIE